MIMHSKSCTRALQTIPGRYDSETTRILINAHKSIAYTHTDTHSNCRRTHHKQIPTMATSTTATITAVETTTMMIMFTVGKPTPMGEGEKAAEGNR